MLDGNARIEAQLEDAPRASLALAVLGIGTFAVGTDGYIVIGVLDDIARSFQVSPSQAGQLVTLFAVTYAVCAPISAWLLGGLGRKRSIEIAALLFIAGNLICYLAPSYAVMAGGRIVAALGSGLYTPLAFAIAASLVPEAARGKALSVVFGGMSVATALGLPLGTYLGRMGDWHIIFLAIAILGLMNLALLRRMLPSLPTGGASTLRERLAPLGNRAVQIALGLTFLIVTSEYSFYSYVSVVIEEAGAHGGEILPAIFLAFGIGAILGNIVVGHATDAIGPRKVLILAVAAQTALLPILYAAAAFPLAAIALAFCWGVVSYMYLVPIQHKLVTLASRAGQMTLSLNSSAIYLGIGSGSALGGVALATLGVGSLAIVAAALGALALAVILATF